jgi:hypothetical protein
MKPQDHPERYYIEGLKFEALEMRKKAVEYALYYWEQDENKFKDARDYSIEYFEAERQLIDYCILKIKRRANKVKGEIK